MAVYLPSGDSGSVTRHLGRRQCFGKAEQGTNLAEEGTETDFLTEKITRKKEETKRPSNRDV